MRLSTDSRSCVSRFGFAVVTGADNRTFLVKLEVSGRLGQSGIAQGRKRKDTIASIYWSGFLESLGGQSPGFDCRDRCKMRDPPPQGGEDAWYQMSPADCRCGALSRRGAALGGRCVGLPICRLLGRNCCRTLPLIEGCRCPACRLIGFGCCAIKS
jgi:hypothetical protein